MERKTIKTDNNKIQFTKTSTTITPDDGFVNERKLGHIRHFGESNYIKGHARSVSFSTDDPRVTKPVLYITITIFIVIGLILLFTDACNGVQREHNKKLNNGLPILHKVPPKRDYGRYFCIMAEKGGTSHGGLTEKLSPFFHAKKQEVNAYGR